MHPSVTAAELSRQSSATYDKQHVTGTQAPATRSKLLSNLGGEADLKLIYLCVFTRHIRRLLRAYAYAWQPRTGPMPLCIPPRLLFLFPSPPPPRPPSYSPHTERKRRARAHGGTTERTKAANASSAGGWSEKKWSSE